MSTLKRTALITGAVMCMVAGAASYGVYDRLHDPRAIYCKAHGGVFDWRLVACVRIVEVPR